MARKTTVCPEKRRDRGKKSVAGAAPGWAGAGREQLAWIGGRAGMGARAWLGLGGWEAWVFLH